MNFDEPILGRTMQESEQDDGELSVRQRIEGLVRQQPYAVLCVQGGGQPYGALVAFAFSNDLRHAVFSTPVSTRKYRLLSECDQVALVIDNRASEVQDVMALEAVTVTGRTTLLKRGVEFDRYANLLIARHRYLKTFVLTETCALFRIDAVRFLHVVRFQEVQQWVPTLNS